MRRMGAAGRILDGMGRFRHFAAACLVGVVVLTPAAAGLCALVACMSPTTVPVATADAAAGHAHHAAHASTHEADLARELPDTAGFAASAAVLRTLQHELGCDPATAVIDDAVIERARQITVAPGVPLHASAGSPLALSSSLDDSGPPRLLVPAVPLRLNLRI